MCFIEMIQWLYVTMLAGVGKERKGIMNREERISQVLNNFLVSQGYDDVIVRFIQISDSYYTPGVIGEVVLGGISNIKADEVFVEYCKELGLKEDISIETLSFLHELGHHNTIDFLDDEEIYESEMIKMLLYMQDEETKEAFMKYFNCPIEKEATIDAIKFCNHFPRAAAELDKQIQEVLYG